MNQSFNSCLTAVTRDLAYQKHLKTKYQAMLRRYTSYDGIRLRRVVSHGVEYFYALKGEDIISLGTAGNPYLEKLRTKHFLEVAIKRIDKNIVLLERFCRTYRSMDPNVMRGEFPKVYRFEDPEIFAAAGVVDLERWVKEDFQANLYRSENLVHLTAGGEYVRLKSEVIIANALYAAGIHYKYEYPLELRDSTRYPDFTAHSEKWDRWIIWEHFGLMNRQEYRDSYAQKLEEYAEAGYYLGHNLICTFDDDK